VTDRPALITDFARYWIIWALPTRGPNDDGLWFQMIRLEARSSS
jgi:hypothetical protein